MRRMVSTLSLCIGAFLILIAAALHAAINVPHLREDLVEIGTRPTLLRAVMLVMWFSVFAMFGFGALVVRGAIQSLRGSTAMMPLVTVGLTYGIFGVAAFLLVARSPHFLGYSAMGLLVLAGVVVSPELSRPAPVTRR